MLELPPADRLAGLFPDDAARLAELARAAGQKDLVVYEVSLHTTRGDAPPEERTPAVAGSASATALLWRVLEGQRAGARRQCAYALAGFDSFTDDHRGLVRLWGLARDLGPTRWLRPTGLAIEALNRAAAGDLHTVDCHGDRTLSAAAYHTPGGWSAAVASRRAEASRVCLRFPPGGVVPTRTLGLVSPGPWATNEDADNVRLSEASADASGREVCLDLPPVGFAVLLPGGA